MTCATLRSSALLTGLASTLTAALLLFGASSAFAVQQISVLALFTNQAMVDIDGKRRKLKKGEPSPEGVILISATAKAAILEVDGKQSQYQLGRRISTRFIGPRKGAVLRIWPTSNGMYVTTGSINGFPVRFLVDTGATLIAMNRNEARRLGIDFRVEGRESRSTTASGVVRTYEIRLPRVKVGDIELKNVGAAVIDGNFPAEILLGNSFLNRLDMQRKSGALELRQRAY
ncbi:MAG: TIGR02281 family clan AA aspartic protease [Chromatiales bacterium]|jgi:aspartyl protease family protein|nr:TIGR02281 family clan AA aspartic protease [Chromatiales bacterium]